MQTPGLSAEGYFVTFIDEKSGRVSVALLISKDGVLREFKSYRARVEQSGARDIKTLRSDGGDKFSNNEFRRYLLEAGIQDTISPPYSPTQNGLAERMNRTLMETARRLLEDSKLENEFWGHAVLTAAHLHNRLPSRSHEDKSPLEHWTGKVPEIGHFRVFVSTTWVHIPSEKRQKLDSKSVRCLLIGYEEDAASWVYRLYHRENRKLILSCDVIIDESQAMENTGELSETTTIEWDNDVLPVLVLAKQSEVEHDGFLPLDTIVPEAGPTAVSTGILESMTIRPRLSSEPLRPGGQARISEKGKQSERQSCRSQRVGNLANTAVSQAHFALLAGQDLVSETLTEALSSPQRHHWIVAWQSELISLADNNTWEIEPLPETRRVIGCRWLFRKKDDGLYLL